MAQNLLSSREDGNRGGRNPNRTQVLVSHCQDCVLLGSWEILSGSCLKVELSTTVVHQASSTYLTISLETTHGMLDRCD